jgi:hypothetical protein
VGCRVLGFFDANAKNICDLPENTVCDSSAHLELDFCFLVPLQALNTIFTFCEFMVHIFMMYNVKPGKMEDYREHSRKTDQPTLKRQSGVINFTVYEIKGAQSGKSPYQIVEDIEVESWEAFQKVAASDAGKKLGDVEGILRRGLADNGVRQSNMRIRDGPAMGTNSCMSLA